VRKAWFAPVLIVVSIVVQLTVLNGLRLPGGGVPDLVLVVVAALAVADGPLAGVIIGFAAGLCLDLAPPGSLLVGQYALVFCLAGWTAGQLGRVAAKSPLWSAVFMAIVVAAAEALSTGLGLVLEPAQVTSAEVREVLPAAVGYDLVLCPFVLYLVVVIGSLLAEGLAAGAAAAGVLGVPTRSERAQQRHKRQQRRHEPRLAHGAARTGDGWLSSGHDRHNRQPSARTRARLRPARGVAGSASGLRHHGSVPRTAPSMRLAGGRRGDGAIGNRVGSATAGAGTAGWGTGSRAGIPACSRGRAGSSGRDGARLAARQPGSTAHPAPGGRLGWPALALDRRALAAAVRRSGSAGGAVTAHSAGHSVRLRWHRRAGRQRQFPGCERAPAVPL